MKKIVFALIVCSLLIGVAFAAEKDCVQDVKVEVGGRYLANVEHVRSSMVLYMESPKPLVTSITIVEISPSGKYALVRKHNEENAYWWSMKSIDVVERLPLVQKPEIGKIWR